MLLALCVKEKVPVTAVTFQTVLHPKCDLENAKAVATKLGADHLILEMMNFRYRKSSLIHRTAAITVKNFFLKGLQNWQNNWDAESSWTAPTLTI